MVFPRRTHTSSGFTLIELLVVISIIGLLSSVVLAGLNSVRVDARDTRRMADMESVVKAIELYANENNGEVPPHGGDTNGCNATVCLAVLEEELVENGGFLPEIPMDPTNGNTVEGGYLYCRALSKRHYTLLIRPESTSDWCTYSHHRIADDQDSCWFTHGEANHGWCRDEM